MIQQIKFEDMPSGNYEEVLGFSFPKEKFLDKLNIKWEKWYSGLVDCWVGAFLIEETQDYFFVGSPTDLPNLSALSILKNENLSFNIDLIFDYFKLDTSMLTHALDVIFQNYDLYRQDNNGNIFRVSKYICKQDAYIEVEKYEAKGHKQTYWAERSSSDDFQFINK